MFEGDIVINEAINEILNPETHEQHHRAKRDAVANRIKVWPDGVLPYTIDDSIGKFQTLGQYRAGLGGGEGGKTRW